MRSQKYCDIFLKHQAAAMKFEEYVKKTQADENV